MRNLDFCCVVPVCCSRPWVPGSPPHKFAMSPMSQKISNLFKNLGKICCDPHVVAAAPKCYAGRQCHFSLVLFWGATLGNHMLDMVTFGRGPEDMKRQLPWLPPHCMGGWGVWHDFAPAAAMTRPTFIEILKQSAIWKLGGQRASECRQPSI